jgi:hypothetical protein
VRHPEEGLTSVQSAGHRTVFAFLHSCFEHKDYSIGFAALKLWLELRAEVDEPLPPPSQATLEANCIPELVQNAKCARYFTPNKMGWPSGGAAPAG